ncbi:pumilio-family RNA binding repeat protein [Ephemerocybe angulata]|uniref:Pumilio-family RNA binding repeat protein n=1 Tax=Ephemerocybe angulata TaxID=980116 RepID=A0A8H6HKE8_9AGAR|nr:pumilio-family RNA binding repeat protein [Tulosesus angulatus]KAF6753345.1 pumilio-family RNA binding repeat protein [Tulosesus angulatus]
MLSADNAQQYFAPSAPSARQRQSTGLAGSIWAPQPQPSDKTWPKKLDSFSRSAERESEHLPRTDNRLSGMTREDVFGPQVPTQGTARPPREIGAIGDGRKRFSPSDYDNSHVEQLLRTLNLNSPAPFAQKPSVNVNVEMIPNSPDFSPASVSSALLTPTDFSPVRPFDAKFPPSSYDVNQQLQSYLPQSSLLFENGPSDKLQECLGNQQLSSCNSFSQNAPTPTSHSYFDSFPTSSSNTMPQSLYSTPSTRRQDSGRISQLDWRLASQTPTSQPSSSSSLAPDWRLLSEKVMNDPNFGTSSQDGTRSQNSFHLRQSSGTPSFSSAHEPINFLSLLHPSSSPPYHVFVSRIIKSSDQQASIFLQQKLKVADAEERAKIVDAICARGFEMMAHRFGNWAVQRCLEAASSVEERRKIVACMRGRIVELATNCYGCHVLQKALDCEEDIRLVIVSELLLGDPAQTLVNKHASHVWSKIMELSWTPPAPPIFAYVNKSLKGKWASLACHETGSLVVQHAFENLEADAKDGIVDELLNQGMNVFAEVAKNQWGSYCIQHILEHGSEKHRRMTLDHLLDGLLEFATNEQGSKSVTKALKEGGKDTLDRVVKRMCEPAKGARRAMIVDLALSVTGSQLIASVLPTADKEQRALLYECIRGHIVTLRGCKTGSKVIWLL